MLGITRGVHIGGYRHGKLSANLAKQATALLKARTAEGIDRSPVRLVVGSLENKAVTLLIRHLLDIPCKLPRQLLGLDHAGAQNKYRGFTIKHNTGGIAADPDCRAGSCGLK